MTPDRSPEREAERHADLSRRVADSVRADPRTARLDAPPVPSAAGVGEFVELLRRLAFPGIFDDPPAGDNALEQRVEMLLARARSHARDTIGAAFRCEGPEDGCAEKARIAADDLLERLPALRDLLAIDVQAAYDGDPAAKSLDEVISCYPGVDAVFAYRVAHALHESGVPLLPRMICEQAHSRTGIDIHPGARIGRRFFIDHGVGVVIGETCVIGEGVKLYQGVTLGARSFPKDERGRVIRGLKRHPTIGDRVTIYAGAVILGGDTTIGDDCVIAGGVFVTDSVPPGKAVRQKKPELVVRHSVYPREREGRERGDSA